MEATKKRMCLCNGLMATIGLGQVRADGPEMAMVTAGDDFSFLQHVLKDGSRTYSASEAVDYVLGERRAEPAFNGSSSSRSVPSTT